MLDTDNDEEVTLLEWCQGFPQIMEQVRRRNGFCDDTVVRLLMRCVRSCRSQVYDGERS